jgi:hypothetical protein
LKAASGRPKRPGLLVPTAESRSRRNGSIRARRSRASTASRGRSGGDPGGISVAGNAQSGGSSGPDFRVAGRLDPRLIRAGFRSREAPDRLSMRAVFGVPETASPASSTASHRPPSRVDGWSRTARSTPLETGLSGVDFKPVPAALETACPGCDEGSFGSRLARLGTARLKFISGCWRRLEITRPGVTSGPLARLGTARLEPPSCGFGRPRSGWSGVHLGRARRVPRRPLGVSWGWFGWALNGPVRGPFRARLAGLEGACPGSVSGSLGGP